MHIDIQPPQIPLLRPRQSFVTFSLSQHSSNYSCSLFSDSLKSPDILNFILIQVPWCKTTGWRYFQRALYPRSCPQPIPWAPYPDNDSLPISWDNTPSVLTGVEHQVPLSGASSSSIMKPLVQQHNGTQYLLSLHNTMVTKSTEYLCRKGPQFQATQQPLSKACQPSQNFPIFGAKLIAKQCWNLKKKSLWPTTFTFASFFMPLSA